MAEQSMVERVARALCAADDIGPDWKHVHGGPMWEQYTRQAHAAIEAMKEQKPKGSPPGRVGKPRPGVKKKEPFFVRWERIIKDQTAAE